jgi:hypothetical protein
MKTQTYPEQYLLITDNGSGEDIIIELGVNALLDIETLVTNYFDALGISVSIETGIGKVLLATTTQRLRQTERTLMTSVFGIRAGFLSTPSSQPHPTHTHGPLRGAFSLYAGGFRTICDHSAARGGFSLLTCSMGSASRICALIGAGVAPLVDPPVGGPGMRSSIRLCSIALHSALTRLGRSRGSATLIASAAATCARLSCIRDCPNILT